MGSSRRAGTGRAAGGELDAARPALDRAHADGTPGAPPRPARPGARSTRRVYGRRARGVARVTVLAGVAVVLCAGGVALAWTRHVPATGDYREAMAEGRYARAAAWLRDAASDGDPEAQTVLGNLYYLGLGVTRDPRRAAELYYAAARRAHAPAQLNLGHLYGQGLGVPQDALRAFGWYHHADVAGSPAAEYYLYQIGTEWTLSPLQRSTAVEKWRRLDALVAEGL